MRPRLFGFALAAAIVLAVSSCGGPASAPVGVSGTAGATSTAFPGSTATATVSPSATAGLSDSGTAVGKAPPPAPAAKGLGSPSGVAVTQKAPDFTALPGATASFGKLGNAVFDIEVPDAWNGDLVMWAHGFAGFGTEVSVSPPPNALRQAMISEGYAWAASSFSENGYTPGIGADDTLALKQYFEQQHGKAKHVYITGSSMGGNVVALSLEHYASNYDGGYSMCGSLGGEEIIDYLLSWAAVAEYTSGVPFPIGQGAAKVGPVLLTQVPQALGTPGKLTTKGTAFESVIRNLTGGPRPFFAEGFAAQYVVNFGLLLLDPDRQSLPGRAGTNDGVTYHVDSGLGVDDAALNAAVRRFEPDPSARNADAHPDAVPTSGNITKPLLTLHGTGDLFVPITQEISYRQKVEAAGEGNLLVQRAIRSGGHCSFSDTEMTTGFNDLVNWVTTGQKPAGDNISGDLSDIGRQFTNPLRPGDPGGE